MDSKTKSILIKIGKSLLEIVDKTLDKIEKEKEVKVVDKKTEEKEE